MNPDDKDIYYLLGGSYHGLKKFSLAYDFYAKCDEGQYASVAKSGKEKALKQLRSNPARIEEPEPTDENDIGLPNRTSINSLK